MQILTKPGMVSTILVQAENVNKKHEMKDVMDDMMKALDYISFFQWVETRKEAGMTFQEKHMGRIKEVVDKIGKITSLKFKYIVPYEWRM